MTTPQPSAPSLAQAMSRRRASPLPGLLLALGVAAALAFAALGFIEAGKTETVVILARDVPYGQAITADDLGSVELPRHRPAQLAGLPNAAALVGQYAARDLRADDLLQPSMLMAGPPDQPTYPNGQALAANMVPLPFSTETIGPLSHHDRVNVGFNDPSGDPSLCDSARAAAAGGEPSAPPAGPAAAVRPYACRLLSDVRVLYVDEAAGVAYLELTPFQSHAIWALQAANLPLWGERYGAGSDSLAALDRLDIGQVTLGELDAPADPAAPLVPGAGAGLPGDQP